MADETASIPDYDKTGQILKVISDLSSTIEELKADITNIKTTASQTVVDIKSLGNIVSDIQHFKFANVLQDASKIMQVSGDVANTLNAVASVGTTLGAAESELNELKKEIS
jgi:archaellum component FlaC